MNLLIAVLCIVFFSLVLLLVILNDATVDVNLFFRTYPNTSLAVVMVTSLLVGIVFTSLISIIDGIRIRIQNHRLRRDLSTGRRDLEPHSKLPSPAETVGSTQEPEPSPPSIRFPKPSAEPTP